MDRTERLLDLVALLLDAREPVSFAQLRELFPEEYGGPRESAERKLGRDKAELLQLGVPVEYVAPEKYSDRELGGYFIDRKEFFLADPRLSPEESAALYAAGAAALSAHEFPFAQDLRFALRKISLAGSAPAALGSAAARRLLIVRPGDPDRAGALRSLGDAVARRKRVHIVYQAPPSLDGKPGERTERDVDPHGLAFRGGSWRLVAYCHLRRAERVFVVDRIESLQLNEQKPNTPDFEIPAGFDAGAAAGKKPWQWLSGAPMEVRLRFAPGSEMLAERAFEAPDGTLQVTYLDGLLSTVLSFGDRVWIESPQAARAKIAGALARLAEKLAVLPSPPAGEPPLEHEHEHNDEHADEDEHEHEHDRLRRLLLVVPAARKRPGITLEDLARELGLDPAQLRSDIDFLGLVGRPPFSPDDLIDISVDPRGRVTVALDQSFSRPPQLTALEALALAAAAEEVAPADPAVVSALGKLTAKLTPAARQLYAALARRVAAASPPPPGAEKLLAQLRHAAEHRREISLEYDRGAPEERTLHPQAVIDHGGRWYVVGHDAGRNAERIFRVDRIMSVRETGATFPDKGPLDEARFQREQLFFPSGSERPVVLRFSAAAAPWALARYRARSLDDGRADAFVETAGNDYAVSLALSLAGEAEIVAPDEARQALRDEVARALRRY